MSFANPTQLTLGKTGKLFGETYRVVGRVVMGVQDDGVIYHWNEYNLEGEGGGSATLVYETGDRGGEWRWFTEFEPDVPLSVEETAGKRVGDSVEIGGERLRVSLVDRSRVYFIEGEAPEGVEVDDVAEYFNAESGNTMLVVSWTGQEVEYYRGSTLPRGLVESVFDIPEVSRTVVVAYAQGTQFGSGHLVSVAVTLALILLVSWVSFSSWKPRGRSTKLFAAPFCPIHAGAVGQLEGKEYRIVGHDLVEIAEVGTRFLRHEFLLHAGDDQEALLIFGFRPGTKDCCLFTPLEPPPTLSPGKAGNLRCGQAVSVEGLTAPVRELFRSTARPANDSAEAGWRNAPRYGFVASTNSVLLLARWNEAGVTIHRGNPVSAGAVIAAFGKSKP